MNIHDFQISQIRNFRQMTKPNPLKTKISDPLPTQPNPRVNSTRAQLWTDVYAACKLLCASKYYYTV